MLKYRIPESSDEILFESSLEPSSSAVDKLAKSSNVSEAEIISRGKRNRVAVGVPRHENLISRLIEENEEIPSDIERMCDEYDFHTVNLSCSFLPDPTCRFTWARFGVELASKTESGEIHAESPIAYDMFPDEVLSEIKYKREVGFAPKLKFSLGVLSADTKIVDVKTQKELILYEPQITAFGVNTSKVMWDFKRTEEKGIWGNKKDLLLIVRAPKSSHVKGRFLLGAEVEFDVSGWVPVPIGRKRDDEAVNIEYPLSG